MMTRHGRQQLMVPRNRKPWISIKSTKFMSRRSRGRRNVPERVFIPPPLSLHPSSPLCPTYARSTRLHTGKRTLTHGLFAIVHTTRTQHAYIAFFFFFSCWIMSMRPKLVKQIAVQRAF